jgi:hypothetical protein
MAKHTRVNRQTAVQARLSEICRNNGGLLTADAVLADAKSPKSPLHGEFIWNDREAAHKHRLEVARNLIASVRVVIETSERSIRAVAYVRDPRSKTRDQGYVETVRVRQDGDYAREVLIEEFSRAASVLRRAYELADALELRQETEKIIARVDTVLNRLKSADEARA